MRTATPKVGLSARVQDANPRLDAHVRDIIEWHFNHETGCPFWLDFASRQHRRVSLPPAGVSDFGGGRGCLIVPAHNARRRVNSMRPDPFSSVVLRPSTDFPLIPQTERPHSCREV